MQILGLLVMWHARQAASQKRAPQARHDIEDTARLDLQTNF